MSRILLIEPDRILAKNYSSALEAMGYTINWSSSGQQAIHSIDKRRPELILLELQLPSHNGLEFLYELRSYPEWQNIPVILLTLVPDMAIAAEGPVLEQLGIVGYLYKPQTKLRHIIKAVNRAIDVLQSSRGDAGQANHE